MPSPPQTDARLRIGAVNYLNSKPLVSRLAELAPGCSLLLDLPSRLADSLAAGRLDVALIPTVEYLRADGYQIVSDACVASDDEVRSVKVYFRKPPEQVESLALDEGSRTSAALAQVLLAVRHGRRPRLSPLPIGDNAASTDTDAVLIIGDRAMAPLADDFHSEWDLGAEWRRETGLPFVFACWAAPRDSPAARLAPVLAAARDHGVGELQAIASREAPKLGLPTSMAYEYLSQHLHYRLEEPERQAIKLFESRCRELGLLAPIAC
ncbi:Chorismate dehydratase [Posidoniimonas polymericola]|uniref:Chorismate dehydratase n=1 Tax=Posidoniimonas polymericola TaxID=2528002 RepID=A0A5C5YLP6_9BACT|nr:menaquinone biosynthesis protein [Posidoniimonas polymericola]TWT75883.1 Chorismate dehydratase [Posidoniimonas polymericola]